MNGIRAALLLGAAIASLFLLASCGSDDDSSGSDSASTYKIGVVAGITGPAAAVLKGEIQGAQAFISVVNKNGGVNGHPLELVTADTKAEAATAVAQLTQMVTRDKPLAVIGDVIADSCGAQVPPAQELETPILCGQLDPKLLSPAQPYAYTRYASPSTQVDAFTSTITDTLKIADPKVALVYLKTPSNVPAYDAVKAAIEAKGGQVVLVDAVGLGLDLSVDANKVKRSGANVVVTQLFPQQQQSLMESLKQSGTDIPVVAEATTQSYQLLTLLKNPNLYQLTLGPFVDVNSDEAAVKDYLAALEEQGITGQEAVNGQSIALAYTATAAIVQAIEACGDTCTGADVNTALQGVSVDLPGVSGPFSYTETRHHPQTSFWLYRWSDEDQALTVVSDDIQGNEIE